MSDLRMMLRREEERKPHLDLSLRSDGEDWPLPDGDLGLSCDAADLVLRQALVDSLLAGVDVLQHQASARQHPEGKQSSQSFIQRGGGGEVANFLCISGC